VTETVQEPDQVPQPEPQDSFGGSIKQEMEESKSDSFGPITDLEPAGSKM
jgi:hypothetical protein